MKIIVPLVMGGLIFVSYPKTVRADQIWMNGTPLSVSTNCDSSPDVCGGPAGNSGWTVYDNFTIGVPTTISGVSFDSVFAEGSSADYLSTNWSIWSVDPITSIGFSFPPLASGNATATLSTDSSGAVTATQFSITGLNVDLTIVGTYWLGYDNLLTSSVANPAKTLAVLSNDTTDLPGYEQTSNDGTVTFDESGNTVFSVNGTANSSGPPPPPPTPEPATWALTALGVAYVAKRKVHAA